MTNPNSLVCPLCGLPIRLDDSGRIRSHFRGGYSTLGECPAVGQRWCDEWGQQDAVKAAKGEV